MNNEMIIIPTMLTIKDTAKRTNLPEHFIRKLCWENKIAYCMAGNKYLVNLEKLVDYLNRETINSPEAA